MDILLNGKHAFLVKTDAGAVICDPVNDEEAIFIASSAAEDTEISAVLYARPEMSAFAQPPASIGSAAILSRAGEYGVGELGIRGISIGSAPGAGGRTTATSYRIDAEDIAVYVLGLPSGGIDTRTAQLIGHVDIILIDATRLSIQPKELSSIISSLDPSLVVANGLDADTGEPSANLQAFLGEISGGKTEITPQTRVSIARSSLPEDRQLAVLRTR